MVEDKPQQWYVDSYRVAEGPKNLFTRRPTDYFHHYRIFPVSSEQVTELKRLDSLSRKSDLNISVQNKRIEAMNVQLDRLYAQLTELESKGRPEKKQVEGVRSEIRALEGKKYFEEEKRFQSKSESDKIYFEKHRVIAGTDDSNKFYQMKRELRVELGSQPTPFKTGSTITGDDIKKVKGKMYGEPTPREAEKPRKAALQ